MFRSISNKRRGSTYMIVLGTGLIVSVLGLSGLMVVRIQRNQLAAVSKLAGARLNARTALDMALLRIETLPDWRQKLQNKTWEMDQSLDSGSYSFRGVDPVDGDLTNSVTDPVTLTMTGKQDGAVHMLELRLLKREDPLEALRMAVHSGKDIRVKSDGVTVQAAPLSCNGKLTVDKSVSGDAHCGQYAGSGTVSGTLTEGVEPKPLPPTSVFATYQAMATALPFSGDLQKDVLAPGVNTYAGGLNAGGLYYIDCGSLTLKLQDTRVHGTLIVKGNVVLDNTVHMANYHLDYPVLIVSGTLEIRLKSESPLSETSSWINFNPAGAPYEGFADTDKSDTYPCEIRGLVHAQGNMQIRETSRIFGAVLCDGNIEFENSPHITHDPTLWYRPPVGYLSPVRMVIEPGTLRQIVQ